MPFLKIFEKAKSRRRVSSRKTADPKKNVKSQMLDSKMRSKSLRSRREINAKQIFYVEEKTERKEIVSVDTNVIYFYLPKSYITKLFLSFYFFEYIFILLILNIHVIIY